MTKFIAILLLVCIANAITYTSYKQCDSQWANDQLGTSSNSICTAGSLITSVAMMVHTQGVKVNSQAATPKTMNTWLKQNGGYVSGDLFVWASINKLGFVFQSKVTGAQAKSHFDKGKHVILNVRNGDHYVLMTSYTGDTFYVNDPRYSVTTYALSEIKNAAIYTKSVIPYYKRYPQIDD